MDHSHIITLFNKDPSLCELCQTLEAHNLIPNSCMSEWSKLLNHIWGNNREQKMNKSQTLEWFKLVKIPSHLIPFYWKSISVFSAPVEEVGIHQLFIFLCALCAPHEGAWRFIRNYYIFTGFDTSEDKLLDLQEYQNLVNCICFANMVIYFFFNNN